MSDAFMMNGGQLDVQHPTTLAWVEVGEVTTGDGPGGSGAVIPVTHWKSVAIEKRMGLPDEGQFTFEVNCLFGDAGQTILRDGRSSRTQLNFRVTYPDTGATVDAFAGFVLQARRTGLTVDNVVKLALTVEITGALVTTL